MQSCQNCGFENRDGLIFCEQCGVALGTISIGTRQLADPDTLSAGSEKLDEEYVVMLHIDGQEDPLTIQVQDQILLGRTGGETDSMPLINLDPMGAENSGVSRRHAILKRVDDRLNISDMGSTNHTFLNGQQLQEYDELVLRDGDQIRLGQLVMRVFYK